MILPDVNLWVEAHRPESPHHNRVRSWLEEELASQRAFGVSELALSGFLRIVTHPKIFKDPSPLPTALAFTEVLLTRPNCIVLRPGPRHWEIFTRLCREVRATGNHIPDAYFAALAIESGSEWITLDGGFSKFPGLRWRRPFGE